jgi:hypothetical protein
MALTRPTFDQTLSTKIEITDPVVMINKGGNTTRDLGFLIDRSYLAQSNVAIVFKHSDQTLYFITTDGNGDTDGSFTVNTRVDVNTGNIYSSNITTIDVTASNINASNITANYFIGNGSTLTSIVSGNIVGQVANALVAGTVYTNSQPNITSMGNLTSLTLGGPVTGNIVPSANITYDLGNISNRYRDLWLSNSTIYLGNVTISATDNKLKINEAEVLSLYTLSDVNGANVSGQVANALVAGTVYTNAQPNITSLGTLSSLTVSGNINSGNLITDKLVSNLLTGTLVTSSQPNITSVGELTSLDVTGNITAGNVTTIANVYADVLYTTNGIRWAGNGEIFSSGGGGGINYTANTAPPTSGNVAGDQWYNTSTNVLYEYINDGTSSYWVDIQTPTIASNQSSPDTDTIHPFLLSGM